MNRVVITGIGMVTPCGAHKDETWENLLAGRSGIGPVTLCDASELPVRFAGECSGFDAKAHLTKKAIKESGRFAHLSLVATHQCLADAELAWTDELRERCGTFVGVGLGGLESLYKYAVTLKERGPKKVSPYFIPQTIANLAAGQIAIEHGFRGPSYCTTSACASSAHAIGDAADWIRWGRSPVMIAGGAEATIIGLGMAGFSSMFALSRRNDEPERASRPWDVNRDGFVMGEGAATLLLESYEHAKARGAKIYAELSGYGATCDAHHITQPAPDGRGARAAMRMALETAGVSPDQVGYINAHGTSTPQGDIQEARAIEATFGERAKQGASDGVWVSSTKSSMGHLLGGAGAVEAAICALSIERGAIPPTINLDEQDPACALDCVPHQARERKLKHVLSNSFGFGGTNTSLLLSAC